MECLTSFEHYQRSPRVEGDLPVHALVYKHNVYGLTHCGLEVHVQDESIIVKVYPFSGGPLSLNNGLAVCMEPTGSPNGPLYGSTK